MSKADLSRMTCTVARTIEIVGDPWTLMALREMFLGSRRFDDLRRRTGASPHILSQRLKRLEAEGVIERRAYSEHPPRHEYRLTECGRDLWPVVITLKQWGDRWLGEDGETPVTLTHAGCGRETVPHLVCSECGEPMDARASRATISPGMEAERRAAEGK